MSHNDRPAENPAQPPALFRMPLSVRWRDLDAFNHVNNSNFLTYLEEARIRWFEQSGEQWVSPRHAPVLVKVEMNYRQPIPYPAELDIALHAGHIGNSSVSVGHAIRSADGSVLHADGHVVLVWIDRETGKPVSLPEGVRRMLQTEAEAGTGTDTGTRD